jgi:hypothetical protein
MPPSTLSHAERLAQRLIDGEGDEAIYHELRFEAMAMAHAWHSEWLAEELVATFDNATQAQRPHSETAAIVQGMLRGVRLARAAGVTAGKAPAWANPALAAAGITTVGMIVAAIINQVGGMKAANSSQASMQPAVMKPNIQIVLPSNAANAVPSHTVILQQPAASGHDAAAPSAAATPAAKASAQAPDTATEPSAPPAEPAPGT